MKPKSVLTAALLMTAGAQGHAGRPNQTVARREKNPKADRHANRAALARSLPPTIVHPPRPQLFEMIPAYKVSNANNLTKFKQYIMQAMQRDGTSSVPPPAYKNQPVSTNKDGPYGVYIPREFHARNEFNENKQKRKWTGVQWTLLHAYMPFINDMQDVLTRLSRSTVAFKDPFDIMPGTHLASHMPVQFFYPLGLQIGWKKRGSASNSYCTLYHHGIYLGNGWVIAHPEGLVRISNFIHDGQNSQNFYEVRYADPDSAKKIVGRGIQQALQDLFIGTPGLEDVSASIKSKNKRARSTTGNGAYCLFTRNCEHFATLITTGTPTSMTLLRIALIPLSLGAAAAVGFGALHVTANRRLLARWKYTKGMTRNRIAQIHDAHLAGLSPWKRWMKLSELTKARNLALAAARS